MSGSKKDMLDESPVMQFVKNFFARKHNSVGKEDDVSITYASLTDKQKAFVDAEYGSIFKHLKEVPCIGVLLIWLLATTDFRKTNLPGV